MRIIDITRPLDSVAPWPGEEPFRKDIVRTHTEDGWEVSRLTLGAHLGTHLDAPAHLLPEGARLGEIGLGPLIGPALVLEGGNGDVIGPEALEGSKLERGLRVLLKTRNSERAGDSFDTHFAHPGPELARRLLEEGIALFGVDGPSVDSYTGEPVVHRLLFEAGVPILENLDLSGVEPGSYTLICLPLKIPTAEGSPCRAVLLAE